MALIDEMRNEHGPATANDTSVRLPDVPIVCCSRCGNDRFIPLTFAHSRRKVSDSVVRPTAKCVTCGLRVGSAEPFTGADLEA